MLDPFTSAGIFLIKSVLEPYIFIVLLRVLLKWVNVNDRNPLLVTVVRLTNTPLKFLYQIMPRFKGVDLAAMTLLLSLEMLQFGLIIFLYTGATPHLNGLVLLAFAKLLEKLINIFTYSIIILAVISWLSPLVRSPLVETLVTISESLVIPVRRFIPSVEGFDFAPFVVFLLLQLLTIILVSPLGQIGMQLAEGKLC
jgi:YggT family protein